VQLLTAYYVHMEPAEAQRHPGEVLTLGLVSSLNNQSTSSTVGPPLGGGPPPPAPGNPPGAAPAAPASPEQESGPFPPKLAWKDSNSSPRHGRNSDIDC
jgi:hypothetical protein